LISYEGFFFFVSKVEHARGMLCEPFLCVPKVGCERSLSFFVVDCSTFESVFSIKGVFLLIKSIYSMMKRESESMCVYVFLKGCPFIHVFAFYLFTSRRKGITLGHDPPPPFFTYNLTPPKKSRQLHEVKESPSNNDDNIFLRENCGIFLHGIVYFLLTHFPIIIIIFSRFDVSGQIIFQPKWAI